MLSEAKIGTACHFVFAQVRDRCPNSIGESLRNASSFLNDDPTQAASSESVSGKPKPIVALLKDLDTCIKAKKPKNIDVLELAADVSIDVDLLVSSW